MKTLTTLFALVACAAANPLASRGLVGGVLGGLGNTLGPVVNGTVGLLNGTLGADHNSTNATWSPPVTIDNGTVVGYSFFGVDSFLGIPFALPPVGDLRLRHPQTYNKTFGTLKTISYAPGCISTIGSEPLDSFTGDLEDALINNPLVLALTGSSEDCLYLNVQRPSFANSTSKLPVVVWIYGGAFQFGSTSTYNAQAIIERSIALGEPFIYVSMAYRLSGFGFMPGQEIQDDDASNIGLHDQRKAMHWVQENIAAFGGDPDHVVIWGESAGAISVFDHTIINNGDNTYKGKPLFHGAVMNSGSVIPTRDVNSTKAQATYDAIVYAAGCGSETDTLSCLRSRPTTNFTDALNSVPGTFGYESVNLPFLPRPDASNQFFPQSADVAGLGGQFAQVPFLIGDQQDEGTLFSLTQENLTTTDECIEYFSKFYFPGTPRETVAELVNAYPDDPTQGSPFGTGKLYNIYPQYKRMAAVLGDITFNLIRRGVLAYVSQSVDSWSYLNTYLFGTPVLGTVHGADLAVLYGPIPTTYQSPQLPIDYYISFFNHLNPNMLSNKTGMSTTSLFWPQWKNDTRQMLNFALLNTSTMTDDYRSSQYDAILSLQGKLRV